MKNRTTKDRNLKNQIKKKCKTCRSASLLSCQSNMPAAAFPVTENEIAMAVWGVG
jgi:hypothetical protein